jgi:hypothetical protein
MRAILKSLMNPSRSYATKAWIAMLVVLTMCLCATVANAVPQVVVTQVNWLNPLEGVGAESGNAGALGSGDEAGSSFAVNKDGNILIGNAYGNQVLLISSTTGAVTVLGTFDNVGPVTLDSQNNLYIAGLYTNAVVMVPYNGGAYAAVTTPAVSNSGVLTSPAPCAAGATAECGFAWNAGASDNYLNSAANGYYFGIVSMIFDPAGDFFYALTNSNTAPNAIFECNVACLGGTGSPVLVYMEPTSTAITPASHEPQLLIGGMAIDPWGNLFFTDSYMAQEAEGNSLKYPGESYYSDLNELPADVATGAGYGGVTTGFTATPTVIYTETIANPGTYGDTLDGVAIDPVAGTVYLADQYNGVFAFQNQFGLVAPTMQTVSTQGAKLLTLDAKDNVYGASYSSVINTGGADTVFQATVNSVTIPGTTLVGASTTNSATMNPVTVILNDGNCTTPETVTFTNPTDFSAALIPAVAPATTTCGGTMSGGSFFPATITFTPTVGGNLSETLALTDSDGNSGTAMLNGVALALTPQTVTITSPASESVPYGTAPIKVTATSNSESGIPVLLSIDNASTPGAGTLSGTASGSTLTINGVGTIIIDANQAGNTTYAQATTAQITITVTQAPQAITFAPTSPITFTTTAIPLVATGGASGNAVTFTVTSGPGAITGSAAAPSLTLSNFGTVVVAANQAGTANYSAAPTVTATIMVNPIGTVATPASTPAVGTSLYLGESPIALSTGTAGATIYYTLTPGGEGTTPTTASTVYTNAGIPVPATVGTYTLEVLAVELGYTNSAVFTNTFTVAAGVPDFSFTLGASALTLTAGGTGTVKVVVTGSPDTAPFVGEVFVGCQGLPQGATCSSVTIKPNGTPVAEGLLTVTAGANSYIVRNNSNPLIPGAALATALCCFLGFKKRRRLQMLMVLAISAIGLGLFTGCGPQWSPTFSVSSVTIRAVSATPPLSKTAILTLTVNK